MSAHERLTRLAAIGLETLARAKRIESRERPPNVDPCAWDEALLITLEDLFAWEDREVQRGEGWG